VCVCVFIVSLLPGQRLSIDELQDVLGDIKHWLPPPLQHLLRKQPADEQEEVSSSALVFEERNSF